MRHVTSPTAATLDRRKSPPNILTREHVDGVYESQELRHAIRERFFLTLNLDPHYRVIAFTLANESLELSQRATIDGFRPEWIREQALTWWPKGFQDAAPHVFRELLEEMVGLGILRRTGSGGYTLRSPNVVSLIGSREDIEGELLRIEDQEPPLRYDPSTFRAASRSGGDRSVTGVDRARRSPLTALQESELLSRRHAVTIIFGSAASGITDVGAFLRSAVGDPLYMSIAGGAGDRVGFARRLDNLRLSARERSVGTTIVHIGHGAGWDDAWVDVAQERVARFTSSISFVRVVFSADPTTAWELLDDADGVSRTRLDRLVATGCSTTELGPWHDSAVRHWLEEADFVGSDQDVRRAIKRVTGNWPILLDQLHLDVTTNGQHWQASLDAIDLQFDDAVWRTELESAFGLELPIPRRVLFNLALLGEGSFEALVTSIREESIPEFAVRRSLRWADLIGVAKPTGGDYWRVDPVVARLLIHAEG